MINFIDQKQGLDEELLNLKRRVYAITTAGLIVFLVTVASGWGYLTVNTINKQKLEQENSSLNIRLAGLANQEAIWRKLAQRERAVNDWWDSRILTAEIAQTTKSEQISIVPWTYSDDEKGGVITVQADEAQKVQDYAAKLGSQMRLVEIKSADWTNSGIWKADINYRINLK